jgi:hypothetical protein
LRARVARARIGQKERSMLAITLLAVLAPGNASPSRAQAQTLVLHVTHHPDDLNAARLADALRKACTVPSMNCRIAERSEATTFVHLTSGKYCRYPAGTNVVDHNDCTGGRPVFTALAQIVSQVMLPGSVSVQDESLERLGPGLLASLKDRLAERAGVHVIDRTDAR